MKTNTDDKPNLSLSQSNTNIYKGGLHSKDMKTKQRIKNFFIRIGLIKPYDIRKEKNGVILFK